MRAVWVKVLVKEGGNSLLIINKFNLTVLSMLFSPCSMAPVDMCVGFYVVFVRSLFAFWRQHAMNRKF